MVNMFNGWLVAANFIFIIAVWWFQTRKYFFNKRIVVETISESTKQQNRLKAISESIVCVHFIGWVWSHSMLFGNFVIMWFVLSCPLVDVFPASWICFAVSVKERKADDGLCK